MINPTESTFVTSSYVKVPAIDTLPENVASVAVIDPSTGPTNFVAVTIPLELMLWLMILDRV